MLILEDSRFEVFKNGTLRINSVEVYDGTWYRCVSSTPAGSIEAQARVQVLEKLKFTPPPRPQQCMEFDKEATVPCSATGREKPTIKWVRAGGYCVSMGWGQQAVHWSDVCLSEDQLSARNFGIDKKCRGRFMVQLEKKKPDTKEVRLQR
ncbi:inactive tyrosine-protein kinase 7-like [Physeter macrocephalus]|uniref:Inactive tyrosine-protein kinase 7-like n=1 Tax=Physeter macrocephalus TaxID=9755 RepID=A0A2Y9S6F1_PHYMC|nr:inactive tyrosine-protein kinase 7-like [Physeter catodon]|eukprot:XP_023974186.1 inactive tyrosine-protein kinase 7-like [Physeter catodon]